MSSQYPPSVVVYVNGHGSYPDDRPGSGGQQSGDWSELKSAHVAHAVPMARRVAFDPVRVHREFPDRWCAYIRANFRDLNHVCQVFNVSERTARKWMAGETGANGGHVAVAILEHPVEAHRMLIAAE